MPELNGLEAARQIREACPETEVIILSMHGSNIHVDPALRAGAQGYLLKAAAGASVVHPVRAVHSQQGYLSPQILDQVIERSLQLEGQRPGAGGSIIAISRIAESLNR